MNSSTFHTASTTFMQLKKLPDSPKNTNKKIKKDDTPEKITCLVARTAAIGKKKFGLPTVLWNLLHLGNPHPNEEPIRKLLTKELKKLSYETTVDKIGNLHLMIGNEEDKVPETMFSAHMDTVHDKDTVVYPAVSVEEHDRGAGFVYGYTETRKFNWIRSDNEEIVHSSKMMQFAFKQGVAHAEHYVLLDIGDGAHGLFKYAKYNNDPKIEDEEATRVGEITLSKKYVGTDYHNSILGADDKVGCYILYELAKAKVPGWYVWHVGEEKGAIGSTWLAKNEEEKLKKVKRCIAFDRCNYEDIIGYQRTGKCTSYNFGKDLAEVLNKMEDLPPKIKWKSEVRGSFTDSASYTHLISECTNLSIGYFRQHTSAECFDLWWLTDRLIPWLVQVKWDEVKTYRLPAREPVHTHRNNNYGHGNHYGNGWGGAHSTPPDFETNEEAALLNDDEFWKDAGFLPPWELQHNSPYSQVPLWQPHYGMLPNTTTMQMRVIVRKYLLEEVKRLKKQKQTGKERKSLVMEVCLNVLIPTLKEDFFLTDLFQNALRDHNTRVY